MLFSRCRFQICEPLYLLIKSIEAASLPHGPNLPYFSVGGRMVPLKFQNRSVLLGFATRLFPSQAFSSFKYCFYKVFCLICAGSMLETLVDGPFCVDLDEKGAIFIDRCARASDFCGVALSTICKIN